MHVVRRNEHIFSYICSGNGKLQAMSSVFPEPLPHCSTTKEESLKTASYGNLQARGRGSRPAMTSDRKQRVALNRLFLVTGASCSLCK
jgi:hypothetical protein